MPSREHLVQVARSLRQDLDRARRPFLTLERMELTRRVRNVSGAETTRIKAAMGAELERALSDQGLRCYPSLAVTATDERIRVFRAGSDVGDLIDAIALPSPEHDRILESLVEQRTGARGGSWGEPAPSTAELMRRLLPRTEQIEYVRSLEDPDLATT